MAPTPLHMRPRIPGSIRWRAFGLLVLVLAVLAVSHAWSVRAFERFTRAGATQELLGAQAAAVGEVELGLLRLVHGAGGSADLEDAMRRFEALHAALAAGRTVELGGRSLAPLPLEDARARRTTERLDLAWRRATEIVDRVRATADERAGACAAIQLGSAPLVAQLSALAGALERARDEDRGEVVADAQSACVRMQTSAMQLASLSASDAIEQEALKLRLASERVAASLAALAQGSDDLEIDAIASEEDRATLARAEQAFAPLAERSGAAVESARLLCALLEDVRACAADLRARQTELLALNGARTAEQLAGVERRQLLGIVLVTAVLLALAVFLQRTVLAPLRLLGARLADVASGSGDLTRRLDLRRDDEIGHVADGFDRFVGELHELIASLVQGIGELTRGADGMRDISNGMDAGVEGCAGATDVLLESMREIDRCIKVVADLAIDVERSSDDLREGCRATSLEIDVSIAGSGDVRKSIEEMTSAAQGIHAILAAIVAISEQVKLLSLNATIEASRAGEAGLGFGVVAKEVKALAGQTEAQTAEIKNTLASLLAVCDRSEQTFERVDGSIGRINERQIVSIQSAEQQAGVCGRMKASLHDTTSTSEHVLGAVEELRDHVRGTSSAARATRAAADDLAALAQRLNQKVGVFRIRPSDTLPSR